MSNDKLKNITYNESIDFIKSLGFISTGFNGDWSNGKYTLSTTYINGALILTNIKKNNE